MPSGVKCIALYPNIQDAIYAAVNGDTVLVADGTYTGGMNRNINFFGRAIVVMSENGPENCIIDCEQGGRGFYFDSNETEESVVQGFTIRNGYTDYGGGIYCDHASPTITGNKITGNTPEWWGGGIYCAYNSSPTIKGNTISGNQSWGGGGIFCGFNSSPTITGNTITGNTDNSSGGGGIKCTDASPTITGNTISGNEADHRGGGISCDYNSSPTITGNIILENEAGYRGGGIHCSISMGSSTITDNTIKGNTSVGYGGGIYCSSSSSYTTIEGNTITGNTAGEDGGGIDCSESSPTITGNTIMGNEAAHRGGGIRCAFNSSPTITNTILWANSPNEIYIAAGDPVVTYSDIQGGWTGEGNIDEDPMLVLPDTDDYRLLWESPCIDTGHPDSLDADGTRSDIGAHFFNQDDYLTIYLTPDATKVLPGGLLGVTYTMINRWDSPESCWRLSQARRHGGAWFNLFGPHQYTLPANYTGQVHIAHPVPNITPTGVYDYRSLIGMPPGTLYDRDSFTFKVIE